MFSRIWKIISLLGVILFYFYVMIGAWSVTTWNNIWARTHVKGEQSLEYQQPNLNHSGTIYLNKTPIKIRSKSNLTILADYRIMNNDKVLVYFKITNEQDMPFNLDKDGTFHYSLNKATNINDNVKPIKITDDRLINMETINPGESIEGGVIFPIIKTSDGRRVESYTFVCDFETKNKYDSMWGKKTEFYLELREH